MTKILFKDIHTLNRGDAARAICTFRILRKFIPDADLSSISTLPEFETEPCEEHNVRVIVQGRSTIKSLFRLFRSFLWMSLHKIGLDVDTLIDEKILQEYAKADVIMSLTGDALSDDNGINSSIVFCLSTLPCIYSGKPFIFHSTSVGPFKTKFTKFLAKFTLNRMALIIAREKITKKYLQTIGVKKEIISLAPDPAFLLESAPLESAQKILLKEDVDINDKPIVGMSVTMVFKSFRDSPSKSHIKYFMQMARITDYLTEKLGAQVLFIPETTVPVKGSHDDIFVAREIYRIAKNKHKIKLITDEYTAEELKGIIGQCDLFIGTRLHACIFATSMHVPTIAIAYTHKTYGIMGMIGQEKYVLNIKELDYEDLILKINDAWANRVEIKEYLMSKERALKEAAWLNGKLVKDLLLALNEKQNCG